MQSSRIPRAIALCLGAALVAAALAESRDPAPSKATDVQGRSSSERRPLEAVDAGVENLRVRDLEGRDISGEVRLRRENGRLRVETARDSAVVVKSAQIESLPLTSDERVVLPDGLFMPDREEEEPAAGGRDDSAGAPGGAGAFVRDGTWLRLTVQASPMPATWSAEARHYVTELSFGVRPSQGRADPELRLQPPVEVRVGLHGLAAELPSLPLRIESPGLRNEKTLALRFVPTTANPTLRVRSTISDVDLELQALPRLEVQPGAKDMLALGLGQTTVSVQQLTPHGAPRAANAPIPISVTLSGGRRIDRSALRLARGESEVSFAVRSSGLGPLTITAAVGDLEDSADVDLTLPWLPMIAAVVGGTLGGYSRRFLKGTGRSSAPRRLGEGAIVAVIAYVAAVLGVGYLGLPAAVAATEAGAFLTGALTGLLGVSVLEALAKPNRSVRGP